jgi:uncharacterized protein (DUF433 family)
MPAKTIKADPVPLVRDDAGRLMIVGTRVPLDNLVIAFKRGESPEAIHESFDTVPLADVYAALSYYLKHRDEIEEYLADQKRRGAEVRDRIEAIWPPDGLRAKLLARLES